MLRKFGVVFAVLTAMTAFLAPTASAAIVPGWLYGVGNDMTCDDTQYRIKTADGYTLQVKQDGDYKGSIIQYWVWGGSEQKWRICQTGGSDPSFTFWNMHNKDCLNLWGALNEDGNYFSNSRCGGGAHQRFKRIMDPQTGMFLLAVTHNYRMMGPLNNNNNAGTIMAQYANSGSLFYFERA